MSVGSLLKAALGSYAGLVALGYFKVIKSLHYHARFAVFVVCVIISSLYGVLAAIVLAPLGKRRYVQYSVARLFYLLCSNLLFIDVKVQNKQYLDQFRPAIYISNHQSMLDMAILGQVFPPYSSITAKKALKYYPFLGWFMWAAGAVFVKRAGNRTEAAKAFDEAKDEMLTHKQSIFMFAEGTRSHFTEPRLLPLKKGAFHFAVQAQVPIVPIVVGNYSKIWSQPRKIIRTGTINARMLKPLETKGLTPSDVDALVKKTALAMQEAVLDLGYSEPDSYEF